MTLKVDKRTDGHTHYWLECDENGCTEAQPDAAISEHFCLVTAGQMGWGTLDNNDYCPKHTTELGLAGRAVVQPVNAVRATVSDNG